MDSKEFFKKVIVYSWENIKNTFFRFRYYFIKDKIRIDTIESIEETLRVIVEEKKSASRFGDGEFKWMLGIQQISFEKQSEELSDRLIKVAQSNLKNHLVCISPALGGINYNERKAKKYWEIMLGQSGKRLMKYFYKNRIYYNANITRFYLNNINKEKAVERFEKIKMIWHGKQTLIVEGELSRMGVGNDLFDCAKTVKRVIAPAQNAFEKYNEILSKVIESMNEIDIVLIALGPTATVLAYDLAKEGIWAVDIGHIDVEYEWYLQGARSKVAIAGKAVNESIVDRSSEHFERSIWEKYQSEIIGYIK